MRIIIQRVLNAGVRVDNQIISQIKNGLLVLLGIHKTDNQQIVQKWAEKCLNLRIWPEILLQNADLDKNQTNQDIDDSKVQQSEQQIQNQSQYDQIEMKNKRSLAKGAQWRSSVIDNNYEVLVVSQFTLYGTLKGNKPDYSESMGAEQAKILYEYFLEVMKNKYKYDRIKGGKFQEYMHVDLVNDGPVTLIFDELASQLPQNLKVIQQKNNQDSKSAQQQKQKEKNQKGIQNSQEKNYESKNQNKNTLINKNENVQFSQQQIQSLNLQLGNTLYLSQEDQPNIKDIELFNFLKQENQIPNQQYEKNLFAWYGLMNMYSQQFIEDLIVQYNISSNKKGKK